MKNKCEFYNCNFRAVKLTFEVSGVSKKLCKRHYDEVKSQWLLIQSFLEDDKIVEPLSKALSKVYENIKKKVKH